MRSFLTARCGARNLATSALLGGIGWLYLGCATNAVGDPDPNSGGSANPGGGATTTGGSTSVDGNSTEGGSGGESTAAGCYSPTQNVATAYQANAYGCACNTATDLGVCVNGVALICTGVWTAVQDGPCMPTPRPTYTPDACTQAGGSPVPSPGTAMDASTDCASGVALGIITFASSGWYEGGLCCAPVKTSKACGARAGDTCSSSEYCAYKEGEWCGQADAEATCAPRPDTCIDLYAPVCGCDGKTYSNSCYAAVAGTGIYAAGACTN